MEADRTGEGGLGGSGLTRARSDSSWRNKKAHHDRRAVPCAPHVKPWGGCPSQLAQRVMSRHGSRAKMQANRWTSSGVNPRCRPLRRPSAAQTVELLRQPINSPSLAWVHPLHWRRTRMFAPTDRGLGRGYLADAVTTAPHHEAAFQVTE